MKHINKGETTRDQSRKTNEGGKSLARTRFDYCINLFDSEIDRMERLDRKAQFYLSFVAAVLGAIFLKNEFLISLPKQVTVSGYIIIIYILLLLLLTFIILSLIAILRAMSIRRFGRGYPDKLTTSLFSEDSTYFHQGDEEDFLNSTAITYASAAESYGRNNLKKAVWLRRASYSVLGILSSLASLLLSVIALSIQ